jgi:hypothetical protein
MPSSYWLPPTLRCAASVHGAAFADERRVVAVAKAAERIDAHARPWSRRSPRALRLKPGECNCRYNEGECADPLPSVEWPATRQAPAARSGSRGGSPNG